MKDNKPHGSSEILIDDDDSNAIGEDNISEDVNGPEMVPPLPQIYDMDYDNGDDARHDTNNVNGGLDITIAAEADSHDDSDENDMTELPHRMIKKNQMVKTRVSNLLGEKMPLQANRGKHEFLPCDMFLHITTTDEMSIPKIIPMNEQSDNFP